MNAVMMSTTAVAMLALLAGCASVPRESSTAVARSSLSRPLSDADTKAFSRYLPGTWKSYLVYQCDESSRTCKVPIYFDETPSAENECGIRAPRMIEFRRRGTDRIEWEIQVADRPNFRFRLQGIDIKDNQFFGGEDNSYPYGDKLFADVTNTIASIVKESRGIRARLSVYDIQVRRISDNKDCEFGPLIVNIG